MGAFLAGGGGWAMVVGRDAVVDSTAARGDME